MSDREFHRAQVETGGASLAEYIKKWRGDMSDRMAIVPCTPKAEQQKAGAGVNNQGFDFAHETYAQMLAASPHAGKLSQAKITAAIDAMKDCGLPYMPRQRREIIVHIVAKSFGLEVEE